MVAVISNTTSFRYQYDHNLFLYHIPMDFFMQVTWSNTTSRLITIICVGRQHKQRIFSWICFKQDNPIFISLVIREDKLKLFVSIFGCWLIQNRLPRRKLMPNNLLMQELQNWLLERKVARKGMKITLKHS